MQLRDGLPTKSSTIKTELIIREAMTRDAADPRQCSTLQIKV
jgi:hypothetical protein